MTRRLLAAALCCLGGCGPSGILRHAYNGHRIDPPLSKPAVTWSRPDGTPFHIAEETGGRVTLLYFGYRNCPDICPLQLMNLATAFRRLGADTAAQFRVLFVTLDPERDTAAALTNWLRRFDTSFIALRGTRQSVQRELERLGLAPPASAGDTVSIIGPAHASAVMAFARDGMGHFLYPATTSPEAWDYDLRKLLRDSVP